MFSFLFLLRVLDASFSYVFLLKIIIFAISFKLHNHFKADESLLLSTSFFFTLMLLQLFSFCIIRGLPRLATAICGARTLKNILLKIYNKVLFIIIKSGVTEISKTLFKRRE